MRRPVVLAALLLAGAAPATAHSPARLAIVSPGEGARVAGERVRVVVAGEGGDAAASFRLELDGRTVDATGRVGGVFGTLSVRPGGQLVLEVPMTPGEHTLTAVPSFDPDSQQQTVVRRFTVVPADDRGSPAVAMALAGVAVAGALGAAFVARRKAAS